MNSLRSFRKEYAAVSNGDDQLAELKFPTGGTYEWEPDSTYIRKAPYFDGMPAKPRRDQGYSRRAGARGSGRQRHDGPYFSGRIHQSQRSCRKISDRNMA